MVFSSATIPTGELNALGRNKPILGGKNAFKSYNQVPQWSSSGDWSDSGVGGGSNKTNTLVPPSYLYDDFTHITTYPSSVIGFNTVYILFDLKEDIDIDSMLVLNHNFYLLYFVEIRHLFNIRDKRYPNPEQKRTDESQPIRKPMWTECQMKRHPTKNYK